MRWRRRKALPPVLLISVRDRGETWVFLGGGRAPRLVGEEDFARWAKAWRRERSGPGLLVEGREVRYGELLGSEWDVLHGRAGQIS